MSEAGATGSPNALNDDDDIYGLELVIDRRWDRQRPGDFHPWFGRRPEEYALAAAAFALAGPDTDRADLASAVRGMDYGATRRLLETGGAAPVSTRSVIDLCSGVGTLSAAASALGCTVSSIEQQPVPVAIARLNHDYAVDRSLVASQGPEWRGLDYEVEMASGLVLRDIMSVLSHRVPLEDRVWARVTDCNRCGLQVPYLAGWRSTLPAGRGPGVELAIDETDVPQVRLTPDMTPSSPSPARRSVLCPRCENEWLVPPAAELTHIRTVARRDQEARGRLAEVEPTEGRLGRPQRLWGTGDERDAAEASTWAWTRRGQQVLTESSAMLESQQLYIRTGQEAVERIRSLYADRPVLPPRAEDAVALACTLLLTAHTWQSSTLSHVRSGRTTLPPRWVVQASYIFGEMGLDSIREHWRSRTQQMIAGWQKSRDRQAVRVRALQADAEDTGLPIASADAVLWDPAVYDNIDYDALARPFESVLRSIVTSNEGDTLQIPPLPLAERITQPLDRAAADLGLVRQAAEARRLVRPNGRIAVYWHVRNSEALQNFLDLVAPAGLVLERAVRIEERARMIHASLPAEAGTYLLVFSPVADAAASTTSVADASRVLDLADRDQPSLYEGLAQLLRKHWEDDDLESHVPTGYKGTELQKLSEFVAATPNPADLLVELGRKTLREELQERGVGQPQGADVRRLSEMLLEQLGFTIPSATGASVEASLRAANLALANIPVSQTREEAFGRFLTVATSVENILRFSVVAWALDAVATSVTDSTSGDDVGPVPGSWHDVVATALGKRPDSRFDATRMTLGVWFEAFKELPKHLAARPGRGAPYDAVAASQQSARIPERSSPFLKLRNAVSHNKAELNVVSDTELIERMQQASRPLLDALAALAEDGLLPRALRPVEEIRDAWGRRRLHLTDSQGRRLEVYVTAESDLNEPVVYIASGSNPRDVTPTLLPARDVQGALDEH